MDQNMFLNTFLKRPDAYKAEMLKFGKQFLPTHLPLWIGQGWIGQGWIGQSRIGQGWIGQAGWNRLDGTGLYWTGFCWTEVVRGSKSLDLNTVKSEIRAAPHCQICTIIAAL